PDVLFRSKSLSSQIIKSGRNPPGKSTCALVHLMHSQKIVGLLPIVSYVTTYGGTGGDCQNFEICANLSCVSSSTDAGTSSTGRLARTTSARSQDTSVLPAPTAADANS